MTDPGPEPLPPAALRWRCDPAQLPFETTDEVEPARGIVGQDGAVEALQFGLEVHAPGQNIYVRGLAGTGRLTLVRRLLEDIRPESPPCPDYCYVHNFEQPERPRLVRLERGRGEAFRDRMSELQQFIGEELARALRGDLVQGRRKELERKTVAEVEAITAPLEKALEAEGLGLMMMDAGPAGVQPVLVPVVEGEPAPPERLAALKAEGKVTEQDLEQIQSKIKNARQQVEDTFKRVGEMQRQLRRNMRSMLEEQATAILQAAVADIRSDFDGERVSEHLDALIHDVAHRRLGHLDEAQKFIHLYEVNLLVSHRPDDPPPIIVENAPSLRTLIGSIDPVIGPDGERRADHTSIHAGSLLRANGGVLVLEALEVLQQPQAWRALVRSLRSGRLEMVPPDLPIPFIAPAVKPEPIELNVKVVLLGETELYYLLDRFDPDFPNLFKVLADFSSIIPRDEKSLRMYAEVMARLAREEKLLPLHASAIAALAEHGARIASSRDKLSARFGRLADIAREASYLGKKRGAKVVEREDVEASIRRTKKRADGPARRYRELIAQGSIRICTEGSQIGQVNGLAVIQAGPLTYGFPTRITATIGPGVGGAVNIERESKLSGAIHTKSFYILGGLMRRLLKTDHALTFDASIAFEQSYGGIDGDSASAAEICCLLSALTDLPLDQGLAMTGAIDQMGNILPIGAVNEKIEGFFDTCGLSGLTGNQGVIIPRPNVGDLMLRQDVVDACEQGRFRVHAVDHIGEAIELFFGLPAGERDQDGEYPHHSVLGRAVRAARQLWERSSAGPPRLIQEVEGIHELLSAASPDSSGTHPEANPSDP